MGEKITQQMPEAGSSKYTPCHCVLYAQKASKPGANITARQLQVAQQA